MTKYYIEAYDISHNQILGNLDGQTALNVTAYRRTLIYKELLKGTFKRPAYWLILNSNGKQLQKIVNKKGIK